jgi:MFS family permease
MLDILLSAVWRVGLAALCWYWCELMRCRTQLINLYGPTFFKLYGLGAMSFTYTTMLTALGIVGAMIGVLLCDVVGRRPLLIVGLALAAIFNGVVGGLGTKGSLNSSQIHTMVASFVFVIVGNKMGVNVLCCEFHPRPRFH